MRVLRLRLGTGKTIQKILIAIVIVAFYAFSDNSTIVYPLKVLAIVLLPLLTKRIRIDLYSLWVSSFAILCLLSIIWAHDTELAIFYTIWFLQAASLAFAIGCTITTENDINYVLRCIVVSGILLSIRVIGATGLQNLGSFRIGRNIGYNANELALKTSSSCLMALYFFSIGKDKRSRILYIAAWALLLFTVLMTGSRKGAIVVVAGTLLFFVFQSKTPLKLGRNLIITVFLLAFAYWAVINIPLLYNAVGGRIATMMNFFQDNEYVGNSISNRIDFISDGWQLFLNNPIFGYGNGNFSFVSGRGIYSHNNYIELLVGVGLVGTVLYYSLYVYLAYHLVSFQIKRIKGLSSLFLVILLIYIVLEYAVVTFQSDNVQLLLVLIFAFVRYRKRG